MIEEKQEAIREFLEGLVGEGEAKREREKLVRDNEEMLG